MAQIFNIFIIITPFPFLKQIPNIHNPGMNDAKKLKIVFKKSSYDNQGKNQLKQR